MLWSEEEWGEEEAIRSTDTLMLLLGDLWFL